MLIHDTVMILCLWVVLYMLVHDTVMILCLWVVFYNIFSFSSFSHDPFISDRYY